MKINAIKSDKSIKIATKVSNFIEKSPKIQKILLKIDKNPSLFNSAYAAILATTIKPISILALGVNTKDGKEDSKYASAKSISTGILDFLIALAIFVPLNKKLDKKARKLFQKQSTIYYQNKEMCSNYKSVANRVFKIIILPFFAYCKFGVLEDTEKLIFGNKSKKNENSIK